MLHHAQRQLLSRCSLRYYSVSAVSGDAVAASGTSVPPRVRRPSASSFGGISIRTLAFSSLSHPARGDDSDNKSSNTPHTNKQERRRGTGKHAGSAMSGWDDGLIRADRPESQERRQHSKPRQRDAQMQGGQQEQGTGTASMTTRSPTSRLNTSHAQPKPTTSTTAPSNTTTTTNAADRAARLTALSSTNLNALFRTRDTPVAGTPLPAYVSATARVRTVLERSAGDYSRFLPRYVGVRKSASRPPVLRTARHALAAQRDVSLTQRRVALHIIGELAQPGRQVSA
ncbi:hypothetical protein H4582DRAFT_1909483 [Lactarius indigo]|nr:hypothetical protein H4582DRAFT_1909483 [Lactarius indigo]